MTRSTYKALDDARSVRRDEPESESHEEAPEEDGVTASAASPRSASSSWPWPRRRLAGGAGALAVALGAVVGVAWLARSSAGPRRPAAGGAGGGRGDALLGFSDGGYPDSSPPLGSALVNGGPTPPPLGSALRPPSKEVAPLRNALGENSYGQVAPPPTSPKEVPQDEAASSSVSPSEAPEPSSSPKAAASASADDASSASSASATTSAPPTPPPAPPAGPPPPTGWAREHIGFFKNTQNGRCLGLGSDPAAQEHAGIVLLDCDYNVSVPGQHWVVDIANGFIRNLKGRGVCLDVKGHPGWKDGAEIGVRPCGWATDPDSTDQRWKFDQGGYVVNRLSGKCMTAKENGQSVELAGCEFKDGQNLQTWAFVSLTQVATVLGHESGRPSPAMAAEASRRHNAKAADPMRPGSGHTLLVFDDVVRAAGPSSLLGGQFSDALNQLFTTMGPDWSRWEETFEVASRLGAAGPEQSALGTAMLANVVSNMLFAATNFVGGFTKPDVLAEQGLVNISVADFHKDAKRQGCGLIGYDWQTFCKWPEPPKGEFMGVTTFQAYIKDVFKAKLPDHTFFETLFTGKRVPSWEDSDGLETAFNFLKLGLTAARARGIEPMQALREAREPRFTFDSEGLAVFNGRGFGFFGPKDVKYASNGANGASVVENLMEKYKDRKDVLGLLMTDSVLSMHLKYLPDKKLFVLDLMDFNKFKPLPGYAPLGGRAVFEELSGRLATVQLEYAGQQYTEFSGERSEQTYGERSGLQGWRYAEKAIIATLMAKTQLLTHVKTIHLELAPALQAVTVDAFAAEPGHPIRRLLEPFISRSVQASVANLQLFFEFRAGEFGLAPLAMEEQLSLLHAEMETNPLNLADLDMKRFAEDRGMSQFTGKNVQPGGWSWRWHQRALAVQEKMEDLVDCWLGKYYQGDDGKLISDPQVAAWWYSLREHVPAVRVAAAMNKDWIVSAPATTTAPAAPAAGAVVGAPPPAATNDSPNFGTPFKPTSKDIPTTTLPPPPDPAPAPANPTPAPAPAPTPSPVAALAKLASAALPRGPTPPPAPAAATTSKHGFFSILDLHPNEPTHGQVKNEAVGGAAGGQQPGTTGAPELATELPAGAGSLWRRRLGEVNTEGLSHTSLKRVLSTLMVWVSWIHEDVGHSAASLVYDPVYTPMFVPVDGVGIPTAPLTFVTSIYRNFVFLERQKLLDPPADRWFDKKTCKKELFLFKKCHEPVDDKKCYADFQDGLKDLAKKDEAFSDCDTDGFYSCMDRVETSASS